MKPLINPWLSSIHDISCCQWRVLPTRQSQSSVTHIKIEDSVKKRNVKTIIDHENRYLCSCRVNVSSHEAMIQGWKKVGNLGSSFPGNLTIWMEIKSFHMKKYIKVLGNLLEMLQSSREVYIFSSPEAIIATRMRMGNPNELDGCKMEVIHSTLHIWSTLN